MNNDHLAGIWLSEFTEPYEEFINAGYQVTVASPKGGESPIDQASLMMGLFQNSGMKWRSYLSIQSRLLN